MFDRLTNAIKTHAASLDRSSGHAKFGTVTSVNASAGTVKVLIQPENVLSGWLPALSPWVGSGWGMVCPLSPGNQVMLVPQDGDVEQGVVIGGAFSTAQRPPNAPVGEFWLVHQSGSFLKLCNDGTIKIGGDLHVQGDVYDQHGPLSGLRSAYNGHTHSLSGGGSTATPSPTN